ncbi:hypothetical protein [Branchiibius hedensis]|uniref:hypothetical protein n=1 Tax=Branchiibius hedensis TaxID=672460 RepID=UPI0011B29E7D|nr:hypothetical protein [Branchiibius hedensis]
MYWRTVGVGLLFVVLAFITDLLGWHSPTAKIILFSAMLAAIGATAASEKKTHQAKDAQRRVPPA